ncbi:hypothetical protein NUW58_g5087 [Xylaria curta]|uniref:Uncharacterized protein n=1 Tax=Xylaria curta TaxID=42375 RepID=A0ACC1P5V8_9PEZI|nr:hypothetical protein NUW58_g5087 [Xylaria curta]
MSSEAEKWRNCPRDHLARSTELPWYHEKFESKLQPPFCRLLQEWSGIAPGDIVPHIYQVVGSLEFLEPQSLTDIQREKAWEVFPWPCIGQFAFIEQGLLHHPNYFRITQRLTINTPAHRFLDLGTCLGQDIRTLLHDGASPSTIYGADLIPAFRDVGYALFKDSDRLDPSHFIIGDIFSEADKLATTRGTWDIVHISNFLHLFSFADQEAASKNILKLLKRVPGSTIIGTQMGSLVAEHFKLKPPMCEPGEDKTVYRHNKETLKALFEKAANELGIKAVVWSDYDEANMRGPAGQFFAGDNARRISFVVDFI